MALKSPNLDDRDFNQLVEEALRWAMSACPQWTDLSPGDPGTVILELFAHLTETMIYRLNRLPEKAYVEFLRLMGVTLSPPVAASVPLRFTLSRAQDSAVEIPRGTRVTLGRSGAGGVPPVFVTMEMAEIAPGQTEVEALAYHCELVEAELAGTGTGLPSLSVVARRAPIVAPTGEGLELIVGVEAAPEELTGRAQALKYGGKAYRIWREAENFSSDFQGNRLIYIVDRMTGTITFAPAVQFKGEDGLLGQTPTALAEVPKPGREIRLWYCRGGGLEGNVAAHTLTTLKDPIPGVSVDNPRSATGGRAAETLQNALVRGPQELHSLQRAITASDFELLALRSSGAVARAKAFTKAMLWVHAPPGTIEVLLVPYVPEEQRAGGVVTEEELNAQESDEALELIQRSLDERRPLGTMCLVSWVRYKKVRVEARAVIHRGEDADAVQSRVLTRLHQSINPLPSNLPSAGWPFGQPLRASHVYDIVLAEPGVSYVDRVRLLVDEVPEANISSLAADAFQPYTWYAGTGPTLFRSVDDGDGWELIYGFPDEAIELVRVNTLRAGMVAIVTRLSDEASRLHVSDDCGETWRPLAQTAFAISDLAWTARDGLPLLMLATDEGLYELSLQAGASPVQIMVDPAKSTLGFYAVAASVGIRGTFFVAVAARGTGGVYLSSQGGRPGSFTNIGQKGEDVRVLEIQQDGVRTFLWAGIRVAGNEPGRGAYRWELQGSAPPTGGTAVQRGWDGGSCHGLAFKGSFVFAATHEKGVLWLDLSKGDEASWHEPVLGSGLPIRDVERNFHPIEALAADPQQRLVMAGGLQGIYRSRDNGTSYENCSSREFRDKVTLPSTWLFCSGDHAVEVVAEDEAERD
ncbi:MAG TPA: baseplate J/gp47 family protein [Pyrinomonadaceae bacterium]|nr:baseplate J/gp47 family protein [Pyrinomonadaceae bacterium]